MSKSGLLGLAVICVAAGVLTFVSTSWWTRMRGGPEVRVLRTVEDESWSKKDWLTDYELAERSGRVFRSQELAGKVHVVSFFFASCPGPCFKQNTALAQVHAEFAPRQVTFLSITCDPDNDSPAVLHQYARKFQADPDRWLFLTGKLPLIRRVAAEVYGVPLDKETHVETFLVYDKWGERRGKFLWNQPREIAAMKTLLAELLEEETPPAKPDSVPAETKPKEDECDSATPEKADSPAPSASPPVSPLGASGDSDE